MPIYEYRCDDCGRLTEALQRMADPPLTECEHCSGHLSKQISAPAFQFKGTGWYVTDYAKKSGAGSGGSDESAEKSADKSSKGDGGGDGGSEGGAKKEAAKETAKPAAAKSSGDD